MKINKTYKIVGNNNTATIVRLTKQLEELGISKGEKVIVYNEKSKIIIEKMKIKGDPRKRIVGTNGKALIVSMAVPLKNAYINKGDSILIYNENGKIVIEKGER